MQVPKAKDFSIKRYLHFLGGILGIGGILFVFRRLLNAIDSMGSERLFQIPLTALFMLVVAYAVSNVLLALAWRELLLCLGETTVEHMQAIRIYALSQLAKYLPGNVFHLAGRQALGVAAGFSGKALVKSLLGELALISLATVSFVFLALPASSLGISLALAFLFFGVFFCVILWLLERFLKTHVVRAFVFQFIFLALSGCLFIRCLTLFGANVPVAIFFPTLATYVVAWLVGLVTPGAPAGLGVREAVLLFFLSGGIDESALLFATVLMRIISILGDVLFYVATGVFGSFFVRAKSKVHVSR